MAGDIDQLHQTRASNNGSPLKSKRPSQQSMAPGQAKATLDRAGSLAYVFSVPERLQANVSGFFGGSVALAQVLEEPDHTTAELHAIPSEDDDDDASDSDDANASTGTSPTSGGGGTGSRAASPSSPDAFPTITSLEGATFKPIPPATPLTEGSEDRGAVDGVGASNASPASTPTSPVTPTTGKLRKGRRSKKLSRRSTKHTLKKRRTRGRKPTSGRRLTVARSAKKRSAKRKSSRCGNTRLHAVGCGLDSRWGLCVCVYVCMCALRALLCRRKRRNTTIDRPSSPLTSSGLGPHRASFSDVTTAAAERGESHPARASPALGTIAGSLRAMQAARHSTRASKLRALRSVRHHAHGGSYRSMRSMVSGVSRAAGLSRRRLHRDGSSMGSFSSAGGGEHAAEEWLVVSDSYSSSGEDEYGQHFHRHHHRTHRDGMWPSSDIGYFWQPRIRGGFATVVTKAADPVDKHGKPLEPLPALQAFHVSPEQAALSNAAAAKCVAALS